MYCLYTYGANSISHKQNDDHLLKLQKQEHRGIRDAKKLGFREKHEHMLRYKQNYLCSKYYARASGQRKTDMRGYCNTQSLAPQEGRHNESPHGFLGRKFIVVY